MAGLFRLGPNTGDFPVNLDHKLDHAARAKHYQFAGVLGRLGPLQRIEQAPYEAGWARYRSRMPWPPLLKKVWTWVGHAGKLRLLWIIGTSGLLSPVLAQATGLVQDMDPLLRGIFVAGILVCSVAAMLTIARAWSVWREKGATVTIDNGSFFGLAVRNDRAPATFTAQFRVLDHEKFVSVSKNWDYYGVWHSSQSPTVSIAQGITQRLIVGDLRPGTLEGQPTSDLQLYYFEPVKRERKGFLVAYAPLTFPTMPKPEVLIQVTLSADPPLPHGPLIQDYWLTMEGLRPAFNR